MDFKAIINGMRKVLDGGPDLAALRSIRSTLDDPVFPAEWREYLKSTNDYIERGECLTGLGYVMRRCGDLSVDRGNELINIRYGIGIGGSMVASGIIGIATATVGAFFVIPMFAGVFVAGQCMLHTGRIAKEEKLFKDIESRVAKILEKSDGL